MLRGIEGSRIVRDRTDRADFVARLGEVAMATGTTIYAWALLPNHAHLLLRSGAQGLPRFMRRLLTGYAVSYNRRHKRLGHLFQNRYKSIVVEEEPYFLELVRYIHLNPLRAKLVADPVQLERYAWCGHGIILGRVEAPWQDRDYVLFRFGREPGRARRGYRQYVEDGIPKGRRPDLVGGGLVRSLGGWAEVRALRRRQERTLGDERILGSGDFVERMLQEGGGKLAAGPRRRLRAEKARALIRRACQRAGVGAEELVMGSRRRGISRLRGRLAAALVSRFGLSLADAARQLGVSTSAIAKILARVEGK
jgi:REP element-mobilizing transposase RayT